MCLNVLAKSRPGFYFSGQKILVQIVNRKGTSWEYRSRPPTCEKMPTIVFRPFAMYKLFWQTCFGYLSLNKNRSLQTTNALKQHEKDQILCSHKLDYIIVTKPVTCDVWQSSEKSRNCRRLDPGSEAYPLLYSICSISTLTVVNKVGLPWSNTLSTEPSLFHLLH